MDARLCRVQYPDGSHVPHCVWAYASGARPARYRLPMVVPQPKPEPLCVRRVRLNRGGYDARGSYWGLGQKLWYVEIAGEPHTFRAPTYQSARNKACAYRDGNRHAFA